MKYIVIYVILSLAVAGLFYHNQARTISDIERIPKDELRIKIGPNLNIITNEVNVESTNYGPWATDNDIKSATNIMVLPSTDQVLLLIKNKDEEKRISIIKYSWKQNSYYQPVFSVEGEYIEVAYWRPLYGVLYFFLVLVAIAMVVAWTINLRSTARGAEIHAP